MLIHSSVPPISRVTSNYSPIVASQPFLQKVELSLSSEDPLNSNTGIGGCPEAYIYIDGVALSADTTGPAPHHPSIR